MLSANTIDEARTTSAAGVLGSPLNAPKMEITYCNEAEVNRANVNLNKLKRSHN